MDITNPANPTELGTAFSNIVDVEVIGKHAYLGGFEGTPLNFAIIDVSVPGDPTIVGSVTMNGSINQVNVEGDFVYVGKSTVSGMGVVDVSDLANPTIALANMTTLGSVFDIEINEHIAYVGAADGISIFDVSLPASPTLLGTYGTFFADDVSFSDIICL